MAACPSSVHSSLALSQPALQAQPPESLWAATTIRKLSTPSVVVWRSVTSSALRFSLSTPHNHARQHRLGQTASSSRPPPASGSSTRPSACTTHYLLNTSNVRSCDKASKQTRKHTLS
jgi:hypothetical protein